MIPRSSHCAAAATSLPGSSAAWVITSILDEFPMWFNDREDADLITKIISKYFYRRLMGDDKVMFFYFLLCIIQREKHYLVGTVNNGGRIGITGNMFDTVLRHGYKVAVIQELPK
jgi:hypothetical protein